MVEVTVHGDADLTEPVLVEGLPGVGLVGKIATDHLVEELGMEEYATVAGEGTPSVAVFEPGDPRARPPVRIFADGEADLLALRSEAPLPSAAAPAVAEALTEWLAEAGATPVYQTGFPSRRDPDEPPSVVGVATGGADRLLEAADVDPPENGGMISGPAGSLLERAAREGLDAVGLVVETDPRFPDPQAARYLLEESVGPIAGVDVDTRRLVERAEEIIEQREELAQRMQQAEDGSSRAAHVGMYQ